MSDFAVTILGAASATPIFNRRPTAQFINYKNNYFLIDCGEGTQMQLNAYKLQTSKINHIFISHLHGDHFYGLFGLLSSFSLAGRKEPLHLYAPPMLLQLLELDLQVARTNRSYELFFHSTNPTKHELLLTIDGLSVYSFPVFHSLPCTGFIFTENRPKRKLIFEKLERFPIDKKHYQVLLAGEQTVDDNGNLLLSNDFTTIERAPRKYVFATDTTPNELLLPFFENANLLYHEATFMEAQAKRATETHHSTAIQAAMQAKEANVNQLLIGHFSARYRNLEPLLKEALSIFENTQVAIEGNTYFVI